MATTTISPGTLDPSVQIFNNFYNPTITLPVEEEELVYSFFRSYVTSDTTARQFTNFLFVISNASGIAVLDLLQQVQGKTGLEVNAVVAYYLNSIKSKTVLYGVAAKPEPNFYVQRNILP